MDTHTDEAIFEELGVLDEETKKSIEDDDIPWD